MRQALISIAALAFFASLATAADAAPQCRDAKGKPIACPPPPTGSDKGGKKIVPYLCSSCGDGGPVKVRPKPKP